jgi:hypothetical protein
MTHWIRRLAGLTIVVLAAVPFYRWLPSRETGLAGRSTAETVALQSELLWSGFLVLAIVALIAGILVSPGRAERVTARIANAILRPSAMALAVVMGALSAAVTVVVSMTVFDGRPNLVDALLQLTHARYFAAGELGGPPEFAAGFWHMQNALVNERGWFSQYPPGHVAALAAGFLVGAPWLVGPLAMGVTAALTVLVLVRLLPDRPVAARLGGIATALNPFLLAHAASFMNHASAALLGVLAVFAALRAVDGRSGAWAAVAGASVAAGSAVRPLSAIVTMGVVIAIWLAFSQGSPARRLLRPGAWATLGGLPLVVAQLSYNRAAFGGFTTFGYDAVWGPSHGLGFHRDPWGNAYGPVEALLYTSADLAALNLNLLETLLPHVVLAGMFLMLARRLSGGERILALWALLPVLANAFYWHHGQFMGPRMLAEFAPAWSGLALLAIAGLIEMTPARLRASGGLSPRVMAAALAAAGGVAMLFMAPQRLRSYGGDWLPGFRAPVPLAPDSSIVFVHGAWETRIMSRLASGGVPLDRVEAAMRQNPTCQVQRHMDAMHADRGEFGAGRPALSALDLRPTAREFLPLVLMARDAQIRLDTTTPLHPGCLRHVRADRFGAVDASFILWLGDLPGIEAGRPMFARDLGPEQNQRLLARYPTRSAWMYGYFSDQDSLQLVPYARGAALLWNTP